MMDAAERAFRDAGGLQGRDLREFWQAIKEEGFEYGGWNSQPDGSRVYYFSNRKRGRHYAINVKDWDGTAAGLHSHAAKRDLELDRLMGRTFLR